MKTLQTVLIFFAATALWQPLFSQNDDRQDFRLPGRHPASIVINQTFSTDSDITPFGNQVPYVYGMALTAEVTFKGDHGLVRVILFDKNYSEYLVYETYPLLEGSETVSIDALCEETALLEGVEPGYLRIEVKDASVLVKEISFTTDPEPGMDIPNVRKEKKAAQDNYKILKLNNNLSAKGLLWAAGATEVSELSYADRKKLYGAGTFPPGFEYYTGGVISAGEILKSTNGRSPYIDQWDWRNRHGVNWITPIRNQVACGSCWAFAVTGATEAQVNLYFNQGGLNLDLSEQDVLSCSGAGSCSGGYPSTALTYIASQGIVDENAFIYTAADQPCAQKSKTPAQQIKIAGRMDFGSSAYPVSEDNLKKMIIKYGPVSGGLLNWSHAMTLVGWQVVKEGDKFYYRDINRVFNWITVPAGSALIGKTVWIFKNSYGGAWGDAGYIYVETPITNFGSTHALLSPVQSLKQTYTVNCVDNDGDGYYWWGLGERPASCPNQNAEDGDDSNASLGPLDEFGNCTVSGAAPVANFSANPTSLSAGGSVTFTDLSTNTPTSWSWSFPGGTPASSTAKNPVVTYSAAGTFNVSLTVGNASGLTGTKDWSACITVAEVIIPAPVANFTSDKTSVVQAGAVTFTDLSTNQPTSWNWSFAGGTPATSNAKNPVVTYGAAGSFGVSLTVSNAASQTSTKDQASYINVIYNVPVYCSSNGNATKEWIASVSLNGSTYASGSSGSAGYQYINPSPFTVDASSNTLKLTPAWSGKASTECWSVWIDFNQDLAFSDSERVLTASRAKSSVSGNFAIPSTAISGTTRMRVSMKSNAIPAVCGTFASGEVKDYLITIITGKSGILTEATESLPAFKLYPNPASSQLTLQLGEVSDQSQMVVYNVNGQMLLSQSLTDAITRVDVESLPAGLYIVLVNNGNTLFREKFMKE